MKIAILFWGLTRSLKYTIDSIKINIFNVLKEQNIDYDIYLHTYRINEPFTNPRSKEVNIRLNFNEYKLLEPKYFIFDELKKTKLELNLNEYRTHPDPWKTKYHSVDNFILAMYSKYRVTTLMSQTDKYDYCLFIRPDVKYVNKFDIRFLELIDDINICIPNFAIYGNFNDRMFLSNYTNGIIYGKLFDELLEYSKKDKLHSEIFHYNTIKKKYKLDINLIKFYFNRVRANGIEMKNDYKLQRKKINKL